MQEFVSNWQRHPQSMIEPSQYGIPTSLPDSGLGAEFVEQFIDVLMAEHSAKLDHPLAFAHMDPPTTPIAANVVGKNAKYNQNLLHPEVSPLATVAERSVIEWLMSFFEMRDGHFCSGSTLANLTGLWCAREHGAKRVVTSQDAHLSVAKSAHILGMPCKLLPVDANGRLVVSAEDLQCTDCLVLTAGTTGRGVIDVLHRPANVTWLHIDAAWAAPLRLTRFGDRLDGIELADSLSISAHKWFYQPKDSAMILFKHPSAREKVSFGGAYLAVPNVGVQGSRGASGLALLASLMASGRQGLAEDIERSMEHAERLAHFMLNHEVIEVKQFPETGVLNWRPKRKEPESVLKKLGCTTSKTMIDGDVWLRQVAANPYADIDQITEKVIAAIN